MLLYFTLWTFSAHCRGPSVDLCVSVRVLSSVQKGFTHRRGRGCTHKGGGFPQNSCLLTLEGTAKGAGLGRHENDNPEYIDNVCPTLRKKSKVFMETLVIGMSLKGHGDGGKASLHPHGFLSLGSRRDLLDDSHILSA
jgi:hypothetical protein